MTTVKKILTIAATLAISASAAPAEWPKKLVMGIVPTESSTHQTERWDGLKDYLATKLGIPVELQIASDYAGVITAMQFKHVDLAYFGPKSYVEASARANAECFVVELGPEGTPGYHGLIISKKGSSIKSLEDAKGKVWAFVDPNSTSGTLVPTIYLVKERKIDPATYFSKVLYSGTHEASMLSIKTGKIDIASTNDLDMLRGEGKMWNREKDFQILWTSPLIPGSPMAWRKDLPESLKKSLREAFLGYKDKDGLAKLKIAGYVAAYDSTYAPTREQIEFKKSLDKK
ncbi:MAG: phosphonate ABC transporter substrate-binding protein [Fibrobacteres bacterium]|nr:phosphonate ABC transporter substrate-binding protein [Fibrobacterota bacterium]